MAIVRCISQERNSGTGLSCVAGTACLLLVAVSSLSAQPAKARSKESPTKPSATAGLRPEAAAASGPAEKAPADPVICVTPGDGDAAQAVVKDKASASPKPARESEPSTESGSDANTGYVKDKLKLSLGKKSAPDQPQQCGGDEAESQK